VKSLIEDNFEDASKSCTSRQASLNIDKADLDALLDATDWVELPANAVATDGQKKP
jgi:hypothetical protein